VETPNVNTLFVSVFFQAPCTTVLRIRFVRRLRLHQTPKTDFGRRK